MRRQKPPCARIYMEVFMADTTICGIAHLALKTRDMQKSLDFYCGVLGLERAFSLGNPEPSIEYIKVGNGQFIELFYTTKHPIDDYTVKSTNNHICLEVEDIFEVEKTLRENGITITIPPKGGSDGNWQCWCQDPDGNNIEFMVISPTSKQATV